MLVRLLSSAARGGLFIFLAVILSMAPATRGDEIIFVQGDRLLGTVLEQGDETVVFEHAVLGRLEVPRDTLSAVVIPPLDAAGAAEAAVAADAAAETDAADAAPPEDAAPPKEWNYSVRLGLTATEGNTQNSSFIAGFTARREVEDMRTFFDVNYFIGTSDGDIDDHQAFVAVQNDWLIPESRWFWFVRSRFDYDQFQSWEYRLSAHSGPGYDLITREDMELSLLVGLGFRKEWKSIDDDLAPEALFGAIYEWKISERQSLLASSTLYPDLEDLGEFRAISNVRWSYAIDSETPLSITFGLEHQYQSIVDPGDERNDLRLIGGLQYDF